jgi:hypothetical protein
MTEQKLQNASRLSPVCGMKKTHVGLGCCCMTTSNIAIPYRPGSDFLKPPVLRPRAKILSREDGAAGADGLHSALLGRWDSLLSS